MKNYGLTLLVLATLLMPNLSTGQSNSSKITLDRTVFESLVKQAELNQLCCRAVANFDARTQTLSDSLTLLKAQNETLKTKYEGKRKDYVLLVYILIFIIIVFAVLLYITF